MLIVFAANDGLQVQLGAASVAPLKIAGAYRGVDSTNYNPRPFRGQTNGTSVVEFLSGTGTEAKVVDFMTIKNPNAANAEVIINWEIGGTVDEIIRVVLAQNERLQYQDGVGFTVYTSSGSLKTSLNQGANAAQSGEGIAILGADVINNNATANTIASVTGLQFPVLANIRYHFDFFIWYTAAATTTGSRWSIDGPAFNLLAYESEYALTTASHSVNDGLGAYNLPATSNASSAATTQNTAQIKGIIRPTIDGDVIARFASEIANSAITAKAGSFVRFRALD